MPKVTIVTVEGEVGDLRAIVQGLLGPISGQPLRVDHVKTEPAPNHNEDWTLDEFRTLWNTVSPGVRPIWIEVAKRPDGYPIDELRESLGIPGPVMSGQLTGVGKALRRLKLSKPDPMRRDLRARKYSMAPEVASMIRELAEEEQQ